MPLVTHGKSTLNEEESVVETALSQCDLSLRCQASASFLLLSDFSHFPSLVFLRPCLHFCYMAARWRGRVRCHRYRVRVKKQWH